MVKPTPTMSMGSILAKSATMKDFGTNLKTNPFFSSGSFAAPKNVKNHRMARAGGSNQYMKCGPSMKMSQI